jgi:hypothetical protein
MARSPSRSRPALRITADIISSPSSSSRLGSRTINFHIGTWSSP